MNLGFAIISLLNPTSFLIGLNFKSPIFVFILSVITLSIEDIFSYKSTFGEEYELENILQHILELSGFQIIKMKADNNGIFHSTT